MTKRRVLILGQPGAGKTRLAGTFPAPLFLQLEPDGCTTAFPDITEDAIVDIPMSANSLSQLDKTLDFILKQKVVDGAIETSTGYKVKTIVLDSIDAIQQTVATFDPLLKGKLKWSYDEWGILLNKVKPINMKFQSIPIHTVMVAHTRTDEPAREGQFGAMGLSVQGALGRELPRWFSNILHIVLEPDGSRKVATQAVKDNWYRIEAKDRHGLLRSMADRKGFVKLPAQDGYPSLDIARAICGEANERQE